MTDRLRIDFEPAEGAVVRLLGLVERRGYQVSGIAMAGSSMTIDVAPRDAGRSLDMLGLQLRRLHGVRAVSRASIQTARAA